MTISEWGKLSLNGKLIIKFYKYVRMVIKSCGHDDGVWKLFSE